LADDVIPLTADHVRRDPDQAGALASIIGALADDIFLMLSRDSRGRSLEFTLRDQDGTLASIFGTLADDIIPRTADLVRRDPEQVFARHDTG
jgi:hypothetical protein